jgi:hypothetical protein
LGALPGFGTGQCWPGLSGAGDLSVAPLLLGKEAFCLWARRASPRQRRVPERAAAEGGGSRTARGSGRGAVLADGGPQPVAAQLTRTRVRLSTSASAIEPLPSTQPSTETRLAPVGRGSCAKRQHRDSFPVRTGQKLLARVQSKLREVSVEINSAIARAADSSRHPRRFSSGCPVGGLRALGWLQVGEGCP